MPERFTPVQRRMLAVLSDGEPHSRQELHGCLADDLGALSNIRWHLMQLRKKLRVKGQDVLIEYRERKMHYRMVRLIGAESKR